MWSQNACQCGNLLDNISNALFSLTSRWGTLLVMSTLCDSRALEWFTDRWWCVRQVLKQLPAKEEQVEFCAMSERQQELYNALFHKLKRSSNRESMYLREMVVKCTDFSIQYVNHSLLTMSFCRTWADQCDDAAEKDVQPSAPPPAVLHHRKTQSHEQTHAQGLRYFHMKFYMLINPILGSDLIRFRRNRWNSYIFWLILSKLNSQ